MNNADSKTRQRVRDATEEDLHAIRNIYAHHVQHGQASFEEEPPDFDEMRRRFRAVRAKGLPWLVAEIDGVVRGYAYAAPYHHRPAYRHAVENSVYVEQGALRQGLGAALLDSLIDSCAQTGVRQMVAVIGDSTNAASIKLHERAGFRLAGALRSIGFKHGRWLDCVLMQRALGEGDETSPS
ncbi:MAG: GNAT family N-acetyltransferase [Nitrospinae bacterium]|nr:GNAT family N-acetyltransferase [Nitrospinota bacterium]